ncbi:N-acetylneuraminic acid synthase N-terminal [Trinorchestia longiramus]|nr:N-acetylneuraminic acid synthase N-terminal [Trinorchestia longiramus]
MTQTSPSMAMPAPVTVVRAFTEPSLEQRSIDLRLLQTTLFRKINRTKQIMEPLELVPGRYIGEGQPCFIIAEIGQNHQGCVETAKTLVRKAKESGADCVKLQKSCLAAKFTQAALDRVYDSPNALGPTYGEHKRKLELSEHQFREVQEYATSINMPLTASAMDLPSLDFLDAMNVPFIKVGSGDVCNLPLIRRAAATKRPLVISTGMSDFDWVRAVYQDLTDVSPGTALVLLQCTSSYPTPAQHAHLRVLDTYAQVFPRAHIGYSGHEEGIYISVAAAARGARVLERHITLCSTQPGSDHRCSLEPSQLQELVQAVRCVEAALGSPLKAFQPSEDACYRKLGKSVVAARSLTSGHLLTEEDMTIKVQEPPGAPGHFFYAFVGRQLKKDVVCDDSILEDDLL